MKLIDRSQSSIAMNKVVFGALLFLLILGNIIISIALIPVILIVQDSWIYFIIIFAGLAYGALFNYMIRDLEHLERKHHVLAAVIIIVSATISFFMLLKITTFLAPYFNIPEPKEQGLTVALIYVASFLAPYVIDELKNLKK
ncbi:MAG: hypothetical protein QW331_03345 [Candidatus Woesearchaeota archaeon]